MTPLQKRAAELQAMADADARGDPPQPFEVLMVAKRLQTLAEMMEKGLNCASD
jgi:hypothetical protein